jgi:hypothetical protein
MAAKERLCEELDRAIVAIIAGGEGGDATSEATMQATWSALPALPCGIRERS